MILNVRDPKMKLTKMPTIAIIALTITALALTLTTAAILSANQTVPLTGTINAVNLGVYSDSACTQTATALTAGTLNPGATTTQTVYIKNTGNIPETLTMTTTNWTPNQRQHIPNLELEQSKHSPTRRRINPSNPNPNSRGEHRHPNNI